MEYVHNVHIVSIKISKEDVHQLIQLVKTIMQLQDNVMDVMMDINLTNKDVKKMRQQYLIQTAQNGEMENV